MSKQMKWNIRYIATLTALFLLLAGTICIGGAWGGTVSTSTNIYGYNIAKGYVINAKTIGPTATSGTVVTAVSGKRIKVIAYELVANGTTNVNFTSNANAIDGSTVWYLTQNSGVTKPITLINNQPVVYMQTTSSEALKIVLSSGETISGSVLYYAE